MMCRQNDNSSNLMFRAIAFTTHQPPYSLVVDTHRGDVPSGSSRVGFSRDAFPIQTPYYGAPTRIIYARVLMLPRFRSWLSTI